MWFLVIGALCTALMYTVYIHAVDEGRDEDRKGD
jgi:hypothetical protein